MVSFHETRLSTSIPQKSVLLTERSEKKNKNKKVIIQWRKKLNLYLVLRFPGTCNTVKSEILTFTVTNAQVDQIGNNHWVSNSK